MESNSGTDASDNRAHQTGAERRTDIPDVVRLQAEEHPLIDKEPATPPELCLHLMHLKAYDAAKEFGRGKDVLDLGCNTGYGTVQLADVARRVVGVDVAERAIDAARQRSGADRVEFRVVDGSALPFTDDSFDVVISFQVLEHIADPKPFLLEIIRILRPEGVILFTTPNAAIRLDPGMTPWNRFHVREFTAAELRETLTPMFPSVRIRGMFGTPTLYETEVARVDKARVRARRLAATAAVRANSSAEPAPDPSPAQQPAPIKSPPPARRSVPFRIARAVTPQFVRKEIRRVLRKRKSRSAVTGPPPTPPVPRPSPPPAPKLQASTPPLPEDVEFCLQFSVADLFYADTDLDRALDFMAICRLQEYPANRESGAATAPLS